MTATPNMPDWLGPWNDLENRLSLLLLSPWQQKDFPSRMQEVHDELAGFLDADADSTLYWLFQLAATSSVGYSASHALVCASLCRLCAPALGLTPEQSRSLTLAALTMNIAMTQLQDDLANQAGQPTSEQRRTIDAHAGRGTQWLTELGVQDMDWLNTVARHHDDPEGASLLERTLMTTDRYAALISPRETRSGRCITDSARSVIVRQGNTLDEVGHALLRTVGLCPPGTFVRLEDESIAVVLRRSAQPAQPWVAPVLDPQGHPVLEPALIHTDEEGHGIEAALITKSVRVRLNHPRLLQLSRQAAALP